jgi:hypothetical protein
MRLDLAGIENYIANNENARWIIWGKQLAIHSPRRGAEYKRNPRGIVRNPRNGAFGYEKNIEVNDRGVFEIPERR